MTLMGSEKVKKVAERHWRLKTTLIFRPTPADRGCKPYMFSSAVSDFRNSGNEKIWENSKMIQIIMKNSKLVYVRKCKYVKIPSRKLNIYKAM